MEYSNDATLKITVAFSSFFEKALSYCSSCYSETVKYSDPFFTVIMMFRISHRLFYFHRTNFAVFSAVFLSSDDLIGLDLKVIFFPGFQFLPGQFCGVRLFDRLRPLPVFLLSIA